MIKKNIRPHGADRFRGQPTLKEAVDWVLGMGPITALNVWPLALPATPSPAGPLNGQGPYTACEHRRLRMGLRHVLTEHDHNVSEVSGTLD